MNTGRLLPGTVPKAVVALILLFLAFPIVVVVVVSFSSASYLTFPPPAFGLRWYEAYFGSADWLRPTWLSLAVAPSRSDIKVIKSDSTLISGSCRCQIVY